MSKFEAYKQLFHFLGGGKCRNQATKKAVKRMAPQYIIKDNRLFYVGPQQKCMRLVVMSEEKKSILLECHNNAGTGNHCGERATRDRVVAGYYWSTIHSDVQEWVKCCHSCQVNDPIKTVAPVLHSIKVTEPWTVIGMDLIGPLKETPRGFKYIMSMTDLFTKWVCAVPLQSKTAPEVSAALIEKLYTFGLVRKIITDQGREFVNELNRKLFDLFDIEHAITTAYHPQSNGQDERTNQNIKRALKKYVEKSQSDWDVHLSAVVYGINTAKQSSTKYSPYYLLFHRHPHLPKMINAFPMEDIFELDEAGETIERRMSEVSRLNQKERQQKSYGERKKKRGRVVALNTGDESLISANPKSGDTTHDGPYKVVNITPKGVATVQKGETNQKYNISRLRPYHRITNGRQMDVYQDHNYNTLYVQQEHSYSSSGDMWDRQFNGLQEDLLKYVLDSCRPPGEIMVKEGNICLTREDFWTLGQDRWMESNIGNACCKMAKTAHKCDNLKAKDVIVFPTWTKDHYILCVLLVKEREILFLDSLRPSGFGDGTYCTKQYLGLRIADFLNPEPWKEKKGEDLPNFPLQSSGTDCGIFMLMYALSICTNAPFTFSQSDMPNIRKWCLQLMERFGIDGRGHPFAHWSNKAEGIINGSLCPIFRVPRKRPSQ